MVWKIFSYPHNPRVFKSIIAGKYNGIEIEYPQDFQFGVDNKKPEFLEMNPFGKVPTLQTDNGAVWESNAMARHVARSGKRVVYGKNDLESSLIDSWLDWSSTALEPAVMQWLGPILGFMPYNKKNEQEAKDKVKANLEVLNRYLEKNTFLVGNRISLADIVVVCSLVMPYKMVFDLPFRQPYRAVNRWFNTLVNQDNFKSVLGEVTLCVTPQEPKKQEPKKEEPKKEAPKKQEAPKKEKETKPAAEEDEEEKPEFEEPKKKNPLDLLPKSKFNLEDYKRVYSNNDTRTVALPNLWENFDPEGYCMYFCDYKYGNELSKQTFMTMNLIGGFYQRLETLHKYAMGSTIIIGTPESHTITGCWIFRGTDIPEDMKICDDFELYDWKRVDTNNAADKELVGDYFSWDKPIQGKPFVDGKIFK